MGDAPDLKTEASKDKLPKPPVVKPDTAPSVARLYVLIDSWAKAGADGPTIAARLADPAGMAQRVLKG